MEMKYKTDYVNPQDCAALESEPWRKYGELGEEIVRNVLTSLPSPFWVTDRDARFWTPTGGGEDQPRQIDHLVVGPNGLHIIETKTWKGELTSCADGQWRQRKRMAEVSYHGSPEVQVRIARRRIRELLKSKRVPWERDLSINAAVCLVRYNVKPQQAYPDIPILWPDELPGWVLASGTYNKVPREELRAFVEAHNRGLPSRS